GNARGGDNGKGPVTEGADSATIDFSTDIGVLNYAYALEQLEAAFYILVIQNFYNGGSSEEREVMEDLRAHEIVHREFFATALGSAAIPALAFDFSSIQFKSRAKVLQTAEDFEFLGVSAYNGAAALLDDTDLLVLAGKIVSVEARHASAIADLRRPNGKSFAPRAFSLARTPSEVLAIASNFIQTDITVVGL
ncbi:MAG: ferritin-like domain-containing protein, partial [Gemmatimonadota bacterium]